MKWVYNKARIIQRQLLPAQCLLCGDAGKNERDLCQGCHDDLPWNRPTCPRCAAPLAADQVATWACGTCIKAPPPFDLAVSAFRYTLPVDRLIRDLKFRGKLTHARLLGHLILEAVRDQRHIPWPSAIVPVPLHPSRYRQRGFNQALEIARPVASALDLPLLTNAVIRARATDEQSRLDLPSRRRNLTDAFQVIGKIPAHVVMVDDVHTSGSTLIAMAKALRSAGAKQVEAWTAARALPPQ